MAFAINQKQSVLAKWKNMDEWTYYFRLQGTCVELIPTDLFNFDSKRKKLFLKRRDGTVIGEKVDELVCSPSQIWVVVANEENNFVGESYDILEV